MTTASDARRRPCVVIVGAGAAGTLVALHLARTAGRRSTGLDLVLVDPADRSGRGVAFGTVEDQHLLNVPASGMSALPEDPGHFVAWLRREHPLDRSDPAAFASRREYGRYLDETLQAALAAASDHVALRHVRAGAQAVRRSAEGVAVTATDGQELSADAVVVATGLPGAAHDWAPESLRSSAFFVPDPWAPGALDTVRRARAGCADVLMVGTGLTMVDVALSLSDPANRPDRVLHAVSRHGRLPRPHADEIRLAAIPDVSDWGTSLDELRERVSDHVRTVARAAGDWRPAVDGLRFQVAALWGQLSEDERLEFLREDAGAWNVLRHRMPPTSARQVRRLCSEGRLTVRAGSVRSAEPLTGGGLRIELDDGTPLEVGWVVNCTGPRADIRRLGNPFLDDLLRPRAGGALADVSTAGMGLRTVEGRLVDSHGFADAPLWTLGALRRGELWESTAVPEIRTQALGIATAVLDTVAPLPRRLADGRLVSGHHPVARPRDPLGLPLSTTAEAAAAYNSGLERIMRLQSGGDDLLRQATVLDPDFALAHAALAMLGHESGAEADVPHSLDLARQALETKGDARERGFVEVVRLRVQDARRQGAQALFDHIARYPRDALAVSAAVPTIAFSGVTDVQQEAWELVEGLAPAYGDHWWYISLLAFVRQDQTRYDEAMLLAESALSCEPSSGHAVHALTHVLYETGEHEHGRVWLDHWVGQSGRSASHRAHFSWHAALHELALGDTEAVRRRYYSQLAPPAVTGVRALIDSSSLLWRWRVTLADWDEAVGTGLATRSTAFPREGITPPVSDVIAAVDPGMLREPETPFVALHGAVALTGAGDADGLAALARHCRSAADPTLRSTVATACEGFRAVLDRRWAAAAQTFEDLLPGLVRVGGSLAQREIVEETLLFCLVSDGQADAARDLLDARLDRRPSPLDDRRARSLSPVGSEESLLVP
ncbi:MAG: hypothetical protein QOF53_1499 [Nocardioidaceae bacterium]|nr:hypothetical protein [Nocardioidaceae bacterium]